MMAPDPFKMTPRFEKIAFSRQDDPRPAKYQLYRKPLIEAGVELYEIKPTAGAQLKRRFREPAGSSIGGLHAKTFTFDRRIGFIGSYNLGSRLATLRLSGNFILGRVTYCDLSIVMVDR
jgi:hypothetical protein